MSKLIDFATDMLGTSDKYQGSFRGTLDNKMGHLVLSNSKAVFLIESGLDGSEFKKQIEIPYSNMNFEPLERNKLRIIDGKGTSYEIETVMMAKLVCMKLGQLSK